MPQNGSPVPGQGPFFSQARTRVGAVCIERRGVDSGGPVALARSQRYATLLNQHAGMGAVKLLRMHGDVCPQTLSTSGRTRANFAEFGSNMAGVGPKPADSGRISHIGAQFWDNVDQHRTEWPGIDRISAKLSRIEADFGNLRPRFGRNLSNMSRARPTSASTDFDRARPNST